MSDRGVYFDSWYTDLIASVRHAQIQQSALGLPARVESSGLLPWAGIDDIVAALNVGPGESFVDLGCGRGGYGLEVALRTGGSVVGIDLSAIAIRRAHELAAEAFVGVSSSFRVGLMTNTGLPDSFAAGVMCIDAMQFAEPFIAGFIECARVLAPGGRLVLTGWQAIDSADEVLPERLRRDIEATVKAAGFIDVHLRNMTNWRESERAMWHAAAAAEPTGDPAMQSMHDEGVRVLRWFDRRRRILLSARQPS